MTLIKWSHIYDHMQQELTINASAFKARCLALMDDLAAHRLDAVIVTKRGKPVAKLMPPPATQADENLNEDEYPSWWGCMRDSTHVPEGFDWSMLNDIDMPESDVTPLVETLAQRRTAA